MKRIIVDDGEETISFITDDKSVENMVHQSILQGVLASQEIEGEKLPDPIPVFDRKIFPVDRDITKF